MVVAITLPILIFTLIYLTLKVGGYKLLEQWIISYQSIPFLLIFFFLGAIGEEIGYMGYAVDPLQEKIQRILDKYYNWNSLGCMALSFYYSARP